MKLGRIQQVGIPKEIYNHPANVFVGGFIGTPPMNFINGSVSEEGIFTTADGTRIEVPAGKFELIKEKGFINKPLFLGIRPEDIHDESEPIMFETYPNAVVDCKVKISELLGSETNIYTEVSGCSVIAAVPSRSDLTFDSDVKLVFDMNKCHFFDESSEMNLEFLDSVEK
jgi:multiple sugar transport system ATP-binding protein